ncbi:MAG TPA: hypothetical protein VNR64_03155 [Vicinamibacterales bacterium]|nr:hypothetical protein [Vicinamibacterales bacterium]
MRTARAAAFIVCCAAIAVFIAVPALRAQRQAIAEPQARAVAQQKISGPLMKEIYRRRGDGRRAQAGTTGVRVDRHGRTLVKLHAPLNDPLQRKISALGGRVVSATEQTVVALMPVTMLERLAADGSVRAITTDTAPR